MHSAPQLVGIDVGGTRIKTVLTDVSLTPLTTLSIPTPADFATTAPDVVAGLVEALAAQADSSVAAVVGLGVVVPGVVDDETGVAVYSANVGLRAVPLRSLLSERLAIPTGIGHDVRSGLAAEARLGGGRGSRNTLFLALGTGIAGAMTVDGRLLRGGGYAGELGHVFVEDDGPLCGCGAHGCLEAIASASAIRRLYTERTGADIDTAAIAALVTQGDPDAVAIWDRALDALVRAITTCITITGSELVLLGGGLANSGSLLLDGIRDGVLGRLSFQRRPRFALAELGERAGSLGAALLAREAAGLGQGWP